jgi:hypothetical protein
MKDVGEEYYNLMIAARVAGAIPSLPVYSSVTRQLFEKDGFADTSQDAQSNVSYVMVRTPEQLSWWMLLSKVSTLSYGLSSNTELQ